MAYLIDKSALVAEIKKRYEYWREKEFNSHNIESEIRMSECRHLMLILNTLETKEADLEEAINGLTCGWIEGEEYGELQNINTARCVTLEEVKEVMRCIYELGLEAQKG